MSVNIHFFSPQHPMSDKSISNLEDDHVIWDRHYTLKVRINTDSNAQCNKELCLPCVDIELKKNTDNVVPDFHSFGKLVLT